jgi:transcriptional regulator with XRE-family HTH domain
VDAVRLAQRLAERLRKLREEAGLSQVQMARRLGISRSTLNRLEAADQNTTLRTLDQLCQALKCQPGDLFSVEKSLRHRLRQTPSP